MFKTIPRALPYSEHENQRTSTLLSAKVCETWCIARKILHAFLYKNAAVSGRANVEIESNLRKTLVETLAFVERQKHAIKWFAIKWLEALVRENNQQAALKKNKLEELNSLNDFGLFETACKILNILKL